MDIRRIGGHLHLPRPFRSRRFFAVDQPATAASFYLRHHSHQRDRVAHASQHSHRHEYFPREKGYREYPFFEHEDLWSLEGEIIGLEFSPPTLSSPTGRRRHGERLRLRNNIKARYIPSGHVLGAAGLLIQQGRRQLYYTGDISLKDQALIPGAEIPEEKIDTMILECTYADDPGYYSRNRPQEIENFAREAAFILSAGGCILIPAFALGKTQELLSIIHSLMRRGQIPSVPLYISGLGKSITEIYQDHRRYLRPQTSILDFELFSVLGLLDDHAVETLLRKPCVIVATNGMMVENTPSARIARCLVQEERHGIFFCGYIDPDTLGYRVFHAQRGEDLIFSPDRDPVTIRNPQIFLRALESRFRTSSLPKIFITS